MHYKDGNKRESQSRKLHAKYLRVFSPRKLSSAAFNEVSTSPVAFRTFSPDTFTYLLHSYTYTTHGITWPRLPTVPSAISHSKFSSKVENVGFSIPLLSMSFSLSSRTKQKPRG